MATIQVRDLPEETYEVLRRRARRAGQSIQAYMRQQLITAAARPTKEEAVETIAAVLDRAGMPPLSAESLAEDVAAERR
jgi:plasmid stability protein